MAVMGGHQVGVIVRGRAGRPSVPPGGRRGLGSAHRDGTAPSEVAAALRDVEASRSPAGAAGDAGAPPPRARPARRCPAALVSLGMALRLAQRHLGEARVDVDGCSTRRSRSSAPPSTSCARSPTGCGRAAWTTGWPRRWRNLTPASPDAGRSSTCMRRDLPDDVATTAYYVAARRSRTRSSTPAPTRSRCRRRPRRRATCEVRVHDDGAAGHGRAPGRGWPGCATGWRAVGGSLLITQPRGSAPGGGGAAVRIVIGEDSALFREGLASCWPTPGHEVVGRAGDARALVDVVDRARSPTSPSSTSGCRPTSPTTGPGPRRRASGQCDPDLGIVLLSQHVETRHSVELVTPGRLRLPAQGPGPRRRRLPRRPATGSRPAARRWTPRWSSGCSAPGTPTGWSG